MGKGQGKGPTLSTRSQKAVQEVQDMIDQLREKTKQKDPTLDVNKELRKIQDKCADLKGEPRRPKTVAVQKVEEQMLKDEKRENERKNEDKSKQNDNKKAQDKKTSDVGTAKPAAKEPDDRKNNELHQAQKKMSTHAAPAGVVVRPTKAALQGDTTDPEDVQKKLVETRLKTAMLLGFSFEKDYPMDFYQKLSESGNLQDVLKPISSDELKSLNKLLGERGMRTTKRRIQGAMPDMSRYTYSQ